MHIISSLCKLNWVMKRSGKNERIYKTTLQRQHTHGLIPLHNILTPLRRSCRDRWVGDQKPSACCSWWPTSRLTSPWTAGWQGLWRRMMACVTWKTTSTQEALGWWEQEETHAGKTDLKELNLEIKWICVQIKQTRYTVLICECYRCC